MHSFDILRQLANSHHAHSLKSPPRSRLAEPVICARPSPCLLGMKDGVSGALDFRHGLLSREQLNYNHHWNDITLIIEDHFHHEIQLVMVINKCNYWSHTIAIKSKISLLDPAQHDPKSALQNPTVAPWSHSSEIHKQTSLRVCAAA